MERAEGRGFCRDNRWVLWALSSAPHAPHFIPAHTAGQAPPDIPMSQTERQTKRT